MVCVEERTAADEMMMAGMAGNRKVVHNPLPQVKEA